MFEPGPGQNDPLAQLDLLMAGNKLPPPKIH